MYEQITLESTDLSPEQNLWRMVILVMIQDYQHYLDRYRVAMNGKRAILSYEVKTIEMLAEGEHAWLMCEYAGLCHRALLDVMRQIKSKELNVPVTKR